MAIRQITIVGTGLIGGSFGLALRQHRFEGTVVGCDKPEVLDIAITRGAIDRGGTDIKEAALGSDVVVFATPVGAILSLFEKLAPTLPPTTLITDTGSTKGEFIARARMVLGASAAERVLPGHPMAGKEHGGIENAEPNLFRNAAWLVTPIGLSQQYTARQQEYVDLLQSVGARVIAVDPEQHDRLCAWISQLPQMISTALASLLRDELGDDEAAAQIGGRALREMTRIARSPYSMWRDIALTNSQNLEEALLRFEQQLAHLRENLRGPGLRELFESANQFGEKQ
jgi:prephenate dehydrogenase